MRFRAKTPSEAGYWIYVVVHDSIDQLRTAARNHSGQDHAKAVACFQSSPTRWVVGEDGEFTIQGSSYLGVLRITKDQGVGIISHEATHAAAEWYRRESASPKLDLDDMDQEERLALMVGFLVRSVVVGLIERKYWE